MKLPFWIAFTSTLTLSLTLIPLEGAEAQYDGISPGDNFQQDLTQQERETLRYNQDLNFRTPTQIQQRQINNSLSDCSRPSASPACTQVMPEGQSLQERGAFQDLQNLRIQSVEENRP